MTDEEFDERVRKYVAARNLRKGWVPWPPHIKLVESVDANVDESKRPPWWVRLTGWVRGHRAE